ncbi:MAG: hypothetical protein GQ574_15705 [Crocinitomix sp.]|nr:hypothetical protein [Crocinitomix sp.]
MTPSFSPSFNQDFCEELEYTFCYVFENSKDPELKRFWCDGVSWAPYYNAKVNSDYLSFEKVKERGMIETTAQLGISGQDRYALKIHLGKLALDLYRKKEELNTSIPSKASNWIEIDIEEQIIEVQLL